MVVVAALFRALVGPGKRRGRIMLAGTLGGISFGWLVTPLVSEWLKTDMSVVCACLGMVLGWGVCWLFARQIPSEAS
jgi:hypothetical protein